MISSFSNGLRQVLYTCRFSPVGIGNSLIDIYLVSPYPKSVVSWPMTKKSIPNLPLGGSSTSLRLLSQLWSQHLFSRIESPLTTTSFPLLPIKTITIIAFLELKCQHYAKHFTYTNQLTSTLILEGGSVISFCRWRNRLRPKSHVKCSVEGVVLELSVGWDMNRKLAI